MKRIIALTVFLLAWAMVHADGFISTNYYLNKKDNASIYAGYTTKHLEYFQLANIYDKDDLYTEINLAAPINSHIGFNVQYVGVSNVDDVVRFGLKTKVLNNPKYFYHLYIHFKESNSSGMQLEHVFGVYPTDRIYISGFWDFDIKPARDTHVWATQVGHQLLGPLYAVVEYRRNDLNPGFSHEGWAMGLEYKLNLP